MKSEQTKNTDFQEFEEFAIQHPIAIFGGTGAEHEDSWDDNQ